MIDIASDTWATIKKRCEERIAIATGAVLMTGVSERAADTERGEIAAYRDILAQAAPPLVQPSGNYAERKDRSGI